MPNTILMVCHLPQLENQLFTQMISIEESLKTKAINIMTLTLLQMSLVNNLKEINMTREILMNSARLQLDKSHLMLKEL